MRTKLAFAFPLRAPTSPETQPAKSWLGTSRRRTPTTAPVRPARGKRLAFKTPCAPPHTLPHLPSSKALLRSDPPLQEIAALAAAASHPALQSRLTDARARDEPDARPSYLVPRPSKEQSGLEQAAGQKTASGPSKAARPEPKALGRAAKNGCGGRCPTRWPPVADGPCANDRGPTCPLQRGQECYPGRSRWCMRHACRLQVPFVHTGRVPGPMGRFPLWALAHSLPASALVWYRNRRRGAPLHAGYSTFR